MIYFQESNGKDIKQMVICATADVHALFVWPDENGLNPPGYCVRLVCYDRKPLKVDKFYELAVAAEDGILFNVWAASPEEVFAIVNKAFPHLTDIGCPRDVAEDFVYDHWFTFTDALGLKTILDQGEFDFKESEELNKLKAEGRCGL